MLQFNAKQYAGTSIQYSPFVDNWLALGTAANFGIVGNGKVFCLEVANNGTILAKASFDTQDSVYGIAWSESHEKHVVASCGDGSIQLFDVSQANHPLLTRKEHTREVFGVNWNCVDKNQFCSCSWDGTIKLWSPDSPRSVATLTTGSGVIYEAKFSPHSATSVASASADGSLRIWDTRAGQPVSTIPAPPTQGECLTADWNKYRPQVLASAGSDGIIRIWDLRSPGIPLENELKGHQLAVKSVKWSPHSATHLLSTSYDMTAKVWVNNTARSVSIGPRGLVNEFKRHTEFVTDCDWSLWGQPGWVATTSFDANVYLWKA